VRVKHNDFAKNSYRFILEYLPRANANEIVSVLKKRCLIRKRPRRLSFNFTEKLKNKESNGLFYLTHLHCLAFNSLSVGFQLVSISKPSINYDGDFS